VEGFVSVYVDRAAGADAVRAAVAGLSSPAGVSDIVVDDSAPTDTFDCRVVVELTGTFDEATEGREIARRYAKQLSIALGVPAFSLFDLLRLGDR
jgi:hypothetical protein